jgi:uncharacterized protein (TIGR02302 family)
MSFSQSADKAPSPEQTQKLLDRKIRQVKRVLWFESFWPRLWLPAGVVGLFVLVSLFGLWPRLSRDIHEIGLWAFAGAFVLSFLPLFFIARPTREQALRRLETRSGLKHRPASAFDDKPIGGAQSETSPLWQAHRSRLTALVRSMKPGLPMPRTDRFDPLALRALLVLLLVVAGISNYSRAVERIGSAFVLGPSTSVLALRVDAWIAPPVYTSQPPLMLTSGPIVGASNELERVREVPEGSALSIRVNNSGRGTVAVRTIADGQQDDVVLLPDEMAPEARGGLSTYQTKLEWTQRVELLVDGRVAASWPINVIPDQPPEISFEQEPGETARKALEIRYQASDDYGVSAASAIIRQLAPDGQSIAEDGPWPAPEFPINLARANATSVSGQSYKDLTAHPWAGLPVEIYLEARDQAGQTGRSDRRRITLPERAFNNPVARAIIEQRRTLVADPRGSRRQVTRMLNALTLMPERYLRSASAYLGLRTAYWRLINDASIDSVKSVVDQLWRVALRLEDGELSDAEEALRTAQDRLEQALRDGASEEEIARLMAELREALSRFLQSMAQNAERMPGEFGDVPFDPSRVLSQDDLEQMLRSIEDLARTGSRDMAQQMLSQLRSLLENLQAPQSAPSEMAEQLMQMLREFGNIIQEQQQLLDETYRAERGDGTGEGEPQPGQPGQQGEGQQGQQGQQPSDDLAGLSGRQQALREALERLLEQMREQGAQMPGELDGAGTAMGDAAQSLQQGDGTRATQQQTLALDRLRQGAQSMAEQFFSQLGQMGQQRTGEGNRGRDPLGRPQRTTGPDTGDTVKVPNEFDIQRAREILQELQRRLGDPSRPGLELDYLERLIRRF